LTIMAGMNQYMLRQACRITTPIFFGYVAIGIPFGLMIVQAGYPWWISPFMCATMYAGAGQYIAAGLFAAGATLPEIMLTEFFVNIRHIVYGLSLITKTKGTGRWKPYIIYALTDETYAVLTGTELPHGAEPGPFFGAIALLDQLYWTLGGTIGALAYRVLEHYQLAQYLDGVDFALTALFTVILLSQVQKSRDLLPPALGAGSAAVAVLLCRAGLLGSTNIMLAAIILGVTGIVLVRGRQFYRERNVAVRPAAFAAFAAGAALVLALLVAAAGWQADSGEAAAVQQRLPLARALAATMVSAAIIFGERLFPFALFSRKDPPEIIRFIEKYIPSLVIAMLIVYCLKDVQPASLHSALPPAAGIAAALAFQLLTKNSMISIFGSTALFMFLSHVL